MRLKGLKQFGHELAAIARNKKVLIPVIAVLLIPVMYAGMFLGAFWDPYAKLQELPVAVVNSDVGTELNGEQVHIGKDFEEQLRENEVFRWDFVTRDEALEGMKENRYYMAIEIPANFSEKTASLTSEVPEPAKLIYLPNESFNFLAAQIGNTAVEQMKSMLNKEVTEAYTQTVFDKLQEAADGIVAASEGASQIADGTTKAKDGAQLLTQNLNKLSNGTTSLTEGTAKLNDAGKQLHGGAAELNAGAGTLADGLGQLSAAGGKLAEGASGAGQAASQLAGGLQASVDGTTQLDAGVKQLVAGLEGLAASDEELAANKQFASLLAASKELSAKVSAAATGQEQLHGGAEQLVKGLSELQAGAGTLQQKLAGAQQGAAGLAEGSGKLEAGSKELSAGLQKLNESAASLSSGSKQLENGASEIASGLLELDSGSHELSSKLSDASRETADMALSEEQSDMFADPIRLEVDRMTEVPNYGTGFAPYFLSLGLFVGALLITIVYSVREPAITPDNGWSWFWSKSLTLVAVGALQAIIADAALLLVLKLEVQNLPAFLLFSIITSITFMMLTQFFVTLLGNPGRFAAIVILILQLTSSAGTFPMELTPNWLQKVTPWLPMTYSVAGLKDVISGGDISRMWNDAGMLGLFSLAFAVLTMAYLMISHRREHTAADHTNPTTA
ncbi:YhgE/Pip domain-containing protein [Paenibacillus sp. J5C_2022]|uniref:YhgE/Pip domain-containing protein n=1 Tax=Paenibacillus sp. J5C2022 TaxID=2977129 RepID=UPI0021CFE6C0|nr:YhgE/Pip domain-containing protein [Paenibacillus sp. J5C2022]MCU6712235.1 YhgE/Pip domain-containing protein [Paenibacillus sp. J5C2022]